MAVKIEIVDQFLSRDFGYWKRGESRIFPNYTPTGERELLVFEAGVDSATIYLAPPDTDEVDIKERGIDRKTFIRLKTLEEGGEPLLRETSSRSGNMSKVLRLSYVRKESIRPKLKRPLLH